MDALPQQEAASHSVMPVCRAVQLQGCAWAPAGWDLAYSKAWPQPVT